MLPKTLIRNLFLLALLCLTPGLMQAQHTPELIFTAWVNGAQEVPAVNSSGIGVVSVTLAPDLKHAVLMGHVTGLTNITKAELHEGAPGQPGNLVQPLTISGNTVTATLE